MSYNMLPSKAQIGDTVNVTLFDSGKVLAAKVIAVKFEESKVYYDVAVTLKEHFATIIRDVDSACVEVEGTEQ